jgi:hypothetical protein
MARLDLLEKRTERLDGPSGRVFRLEDEMEDLVGPDSDIVDLTERLEELDRAHGRAFRVASPVEPGDVVCATDEEGHAERSATAYDPRVIGVVGASIGAERVRVVLQGIARCRVDAKVPVRVGDLLVSSAVPGHACVAAERDRALGCIIGKALAPLGKGRGQIPILVMIR